MIVRRADPSDERFLWEMLAVAADWRPGTTVRAVDEIAADPELARYLVGWPSTGDVGVVAEDEGSPIGAAWCRHFGVEEPGYGFVAPDVPELTVGVVARRRGRGVGRRLLREVVREARDRGIGRISLSVEVDNPAMALYTGLGFVEVSRVADSPVMVLDVHAV